MRLTPIKKDSLIEKKNVLNEMRAYNMKLQELRFFSIYLSKINARDPKTRLVRFSLSEFERIMELVRVQAKDIKPVVDSLLCKIVHVPTERGGFSAFQLFKECKVDQADDGTWYVEIDAHDKALPLMFEFKKHYFTYQLWNALRLTSPNHLRMYEILKQYEKKGERSVKIEELRALLGIEQREYQGRTAWSDFKRRVLDSCKVALAEKTDVKYTYEPIRNGRGGKVTGIRFSIEKNSDYVDQLTLGEFIELQDEEFLSEEEKKETQYDEHLRFYSGAIDYEFTNEEMQLIVKAASEIYGERGKYDFIREQYLKMKKYDPIHRFSYLIKVIKEEVKNYEGSKYA